MPEARVIFAEQALLPEGWGERVAITIDDAGMIRSLASDLDAPPPAAEQVEILVPGIPNCHSHAFQRAMAGLAEVRGDGEDSFWSWRETMYRLLQSIGPEELAIVAEQLYIEMLKGGYTGVAEFHYLHRDRNGESYSDPAEMSRRVIDAAQAAGIHITHLPVLYCHSDFGGAPPTAEQCRFVQGVDEYLQILQDLQSAYADSGNVNFGVAPHSLRAVTEAELRELLSAIESAMPVHIHIAEQEREVSSCLAANGKRPVAWLLESFEPDGRWCLVHATHLDDRELADMAASGVVAGLCPTTEANLGDGIFPAVEYLGAGGRFAIGSDSQVTVDPAQELRLLEYAQRLQHQRRNMLASAAQPAVGEYLYRGALAGGAAALGIESGSIIPGARADLVVLDGKHPGLCGKRGSALLDSWIFACNSSPVRHVMVGGEWRVRDGAHPREAEAAEAFRRLMQATG